MLKCDFENLNFEIFGGAVDNFGKKYKKEGPLLIRGHILLWFRCAARYSNFKLTKTQLMS